MGHATVTNISKAVNRCLHLGPYSIKEITDYLESRGETVHAGEGNLGERFMLAQAVGDVIEFLYKQHEVVEPIDMTRKQKKILKQWCTAEMTDWDCGDDGEGGEYGIFDSIKWKSLKSRLPILRYVEH